MLEVDGDCYLWRKVRLVSKLIVDCIDAVLDCFGKHVQSASIIDTIDELHQRGCGFRSITESIDTTTAGGRLIFHIFGALAEFERSIIRERTIAGLQAARARGRKGGRPKALGDERMAAVGALVRDGKLSIQQIAKQVGVSPATIYKHIPRPRSAMEAADA